MQESTSVAIADDAKFSQKIFPWTISEEYSQGLETGGYWREVAAMVGSDLRNHLQATLNTLVLAGKKVDKSLVEDLVKNPRTINDQVVYLNKIILDL
jgi:hypothetical protein